MKIKKLHWFFIIFILVGIISVCSYEIMRNIKLSNPQIIGDIAFDVNKKSGYTVYIEEDSSFISYLVLTSKSTRIKN